MIHRLALIGEPPESRSHEGPGITPRIREGAKIEAFCSVDAGTERATFVGNAWLMKGCHVGHDASIGDGCELAPHVVVGGFAVLHPNVRVGMNATIRNRVRIGEGARIGMGAVVTKDVPAGETWIGNPARDIREDPRIDPFWYEWLDRRG